MRNLLRLAPCLTLTLTTLLGISLLLTVVANANAVTTRKNPDSDSGSSRYTLKIESEPAHESHFGIDLFIETNINYGTDGGLYAELVGNRAFQTQPAGTSTTDLGKGGLANWTSVGGASLNLTTKNQLSSALPKSVIVGPGKSKGTGKSKGKGSGAYGIQNTGITSGIPVSKETYQLSFWARAEKSQTGNVDMTVGLYTLDMSTVWASQSLSAGLSTEWKQFNTTLTPDKAAPNDQNVLALTLPEDSQVNVQLNLVSLFPPTYKNTVARKDLAQHLEAVKPKLVRVPGGNDMEGNSFEGHFVWNNSVGPLTRRPGRLGTWAGWNTEGFGLMEQFDLIESMGATPILGVYDGFSIPNSSVPQDQLQPFVDSALNELHFFLDAEGSSKWADLRAQYGRAQPYDLQHVEIGNEGELARFAAMHPTLSPNAKLALGSSPTFGYRYPAFANAISREFPHLQIISSSPYNYSGIFPGIDQHDYNTPAYFVGEYHRMDEWPRNGTKIYELEYAVINSGEGGPSEDLYDGPHRLQRPTLEAALGEAVFTLGLEKNGDLCYGAAYAPIFDRYGFSQWTPDLIQFDTTSSVLSTSYYVQQGFGQYAIDYNHKVETSAKPSDVSVYHSVGSTKDGKVIVKLANVGSKSREVEIAVDGKSKFGKGSVWTLAGEDVKASNSLSSPDNVTPETRALEKKEMKEDGSVQISLPANSFVIVTLDS